MANNKMISIGAMDEIIKDYFPAEEVVDYYGQELVIQKLMPYTAVVEMVRKLVNGCFGDDGSFHPEVFDFGLRLCYIEACTNVRLPENVEKQYVLLYRTDLWDTVFKAINRAQYEDICRSAAAAIRVRNEANRALFENEVQNVITQVNTIGQQLGELFGNVTADDVKKLVQAIGENGLDEKKLVSAVVQEQNKLHDNVIEFPAAEGTEQSNDGE